MFNLAGKAYSLAIQHGSWGRNRYGMYGINKYGISTGYIQQRLMEKYMKTCESAIVCFKKNTWRFSSAQGNNKTQKMMMTLPPQKKGGLFNTPPQVLAIKMRCSSQKRLRNSESEIHGVPNLTWWFPHGHSRPSFSHSPPAVSASCLICWELGMQLELPWLCWLRAHTKWTVDS